MLNREEHQANAAADSGRQAAAAGVVADAPPRLIGGEQEKPGALTGEQVGGVNWDILQNYEYFSTHLTDSKGRLIEVPIRRGRKDAALIDYLTFTFHQDSIFHHFKNRLVGDNEIVVAASELMHEIFGFGVTKQMLGKGRFFYQSYYQLGPDNSAYGTLHHGGQRDTVLVDLSALGCQAAKEGWEIRLYQFLHKAQKPKITRCDVAHDFFNGEYTPDQALADHEKGLFTRNHFTPKRECRGTAWQSEDYTGKTLYIGRRGSARLVRVYEKGRQLGDKTSPWVRFEIEFRKNDCVIPFDILLFPGQYLSGAYPVGEIIFGKDVKRIDTATNTVNLSFDRRIAHGRNQVGRLVRFLYDIGYSPERIVEELIAEEGKYPKGLEPMEYDCTTRNICFFHHPGFAPNQKDEFGMLHDYYFSDEQQRSAEKQAEQLIEAKMFDYRYPQGEQDD